MRTDRFARVVTGSAWLGVATMLVSLPLTVAAATLESLVMPGPVIEAHADIEDQCSSCHDVFDRSAQTRLCLDCHESVGADLAEQTGFHGRNRDTATAPCKQCHTEHRGRDADVVGLHPEMFDHAQTDFPLGGAHTQLSCASCHAAGARWAEAPTTCQGCHSDDDVHQTRMGAQCGDCHDDARWKDATFDHDETAFPLTGKHRPLACLACHGDQRFEATTTECVDCHRLDDVHGGARGDACGTCHGSSTWQAEFDHGRATGFALRGAHEQLSCRNCHVSESDYQGLPTDCQGCHSGDDAHRGRNGPRCGDCHGEAHWQVSFDHGIETDYPLLGAHAELACTACHKGNLTDPLPGQCAGCHGAGDPHGDANAECAACHEPASWSEVPRFHHDLTSFALVGMHRAASCEQCHATLAFSTSPGECKDCHAGLDPHGGVFTDACESCHNPVGWNLWQFDHGRQTRFALTGAHDGLACEACHTPGQRGAQPSMACGTCHRADDVHRGSFGPQCDRCHDTDTFANAIIPD